MSQTLGVAILAAGEGKRLKLAPPKPLVSLCGRKLVDFPLTESLAFAREAELERSALIVVTGHRRDEVEGYLKQEYSGRVGLALQPQPRGTADALKSYFESDKKTKQTDLTLVFCADTPLIRQGDLLSLYQALVAGGSQAVAAVFRTDNPHGYGRVVEGKPGFHIVEERDADADIQKISVVNSGLYLFRTPFLLQHIDQIKPGGSGEFYLTDIFQDQWPVETVFFPNSSAFLGVNTVRQLGDAEHRIRQEINQRHQANGVHIIDHRHTYIDWDVAIGAGSVIHPHNFIYGGVRLGASVTMEPFCTIRETEIADHACIKSYCYLEGAVVGEGASIGPFARIRPGSDIGPSARVGNFVETKQAKLHRGVKVAHLSYVGDAEIGDETNIGCGFITCNYDGANKHKTTVGKGAFIGSDTQIVAPVSIGDGAYIGSGSTINRDVPDGAFAVARAKQVTREGMAKRFIKKEVC